jgi:two-component system NtrC family response regulator
MNLDLQAKLLRVLETGTFNKVGDATTTKVDVRVIAATNRDLKEEITKGHFREDLFYRLSAFQINLPSLRDRREDIEPLAKFFINHFSAKINTRVTGMTAGFLKALKQHAWKGNIRELKNVIERAVILTDTPEVSEAVLPIDFYAHDELQGDNSFDLASVEKKHIQKILTWTKGNKTQAAKLLGIGLTTLYQKIKDYNL